MCLSLRRFYRELCVHFSPLPAPARAFSAPKGFELICLRECDDLNRFGDLETPCVPRVVGTPDVKCFSSVGLQLERTNLGKKSLCVSVWPGHPEKIINMGAQTPLAAKDMDESIHKAIGATSRLYKSLLNPDLAMMRAKRQSVWGQRGEQHFHVQNSREKRSIAEFGGISRTSSAIIRGSQWAPDTNTAHEKEDVIPCEASRQHGQSSRLVCK